MEKFTIIIPTLWKAEEIHTTVERASECELVGEIIIIDNAPNKKHEEVKSEKLRKVSRGKNIYVNKSWNLGAKLSNNDKLCICNDDVIFDVKRTLKFVNSVDLKKMGIIGCIRMKHDTGGDIEIEEIEDFIASGFGVLMFIHKKNYREIPQYVDIWWGDYWLFKNVERKHVLKNIGLEGKYKTSVKKFRYITEKDTFNKFTKLDPQIEAEKGKLSYAVSYPLYKVKGILRYFTFYLFKTVRGYLRKAISVMLKSERSEKKA